MKAITILSLSILMFAATSFASANENTERTTNTAACDGISAGSLDCLQSETQLILDDASARMTLMVIDKMRKLDYAKNEGALLDRLQKETEDISIMQPVFAVASFIEKQMAKRQQKNQTDSTMK